MSFDDGIRALNAKLDNVMQLFEQNGMANVCNSNFVNRVLLSMYHANYQSMQAGNLDYFDKFQHYNSCFDHYSS